MVMIVLGKIKYKSKSIKIILIILLNQLTIFIRVFSNFVTPCTSPPICYFDTNQLILVLISVVNSVNERIPPMPEYVVWYVDTLNHVHTDSVVAEMAPEEDICLGKLCSDGKERNLWRCDREVINALVKNREEQQLQFQIYRQKGKHGQVEHWTFESFKAFRPRRMSDSKRLAILEQEAMELYSC